MQDDGWKTQNSTIAKKCRARLCIPCLARYFFVIPPSWVLKPFCRITSLTFICQRVWQYFKSRLPQRSNITPFECNPGRVIKSFKINGTNSFLLNDVKRFDRWGGNGFNSLLTFGTLTKPPERPCTHGQAWEFPGASSSVVAILSQEG